MKRASLVLVGVFGLAACGGGGQQSAPPASQAPAAAPATAAAAPAAASEAAPAAPQFGVPECDEYLTKLAACADHVPEQMKGAIMQQLEQTKAQWKAAASTAAGKAALATGCKQATEAAKTSMKASGCTW
jgi:hypothetical protein